MDYASVSLITAKPKLREKLEIVQNEAARIILGAPRWTKALNLMEANLLPLESWTDLISAQFISKASKLPGTQTWGKILRLLEQDRKLFANNSRLSHTARVLICYQLKEQLLAKGIDSLYPVFVEALPWAQTLIEFSVMSLSRRKNQYTMPSLKAEAERVIAAITPPGSRTYFTDGSVKPCCRRRLCSNGCHTIHEGNRQCLLNTGRGSSNHGSSSPHIPDGRTHGHTYRLPSS